MNQKINRIGQIIAVLVTISSIAGITSCDKYSYTLPVINPSDSVHFGAEIQPIFNDNCVSCHGGLKPPDLREGKSFQALTKGSYITLPGETSELYTIMKGTDHAPRSSDVDKQKVLIWINQGAKNN